MLALVLCVLSVSVVCIAHDGPGRDVAGLDSDDAEEAAGQVLYESDPVVKAALVLPGVSLGEFMEGDSFREALIGTLASITGVTEELVMVTATKANYDQVEEDTETAVTSPASLNPIEPNATEANTTKPITIETDATEINETVAADLLNNESEVDDEPDPDFSRLASQQFSETSVVEFEIVCDDGPQADKIVELLKASTNSSVHGLAQTFTNELKARGHTNSIGDVSFREGGAPEAVGPQAITPMTSSTSDEVNEAFSSSQRPSSSMPVSSETSNDDCGSSTALFSACAGRETGWKSFRDGLCVGIQNRNGASDVTQGALIASDVTQGALITLGESIPNDTTSGGDCAAVARHLAACSARPHSWAAFVEKACSQVPPAGSV